MDLQAVSQHLKEEIGATMALLVAGYSVAQISRQVNLLSRQFQALGICYLLNDADRHRYQENLARSAQARVFLNQSLYQQGQGSDRHLGLSRSEGIFSALAAGQMPLALAIIDSAYPNWHRGWEYEDDHCYYQVIHTLAAWLAGKGNGDCSAALARWAQVIDGEDAPRLAICQALVDRNAEDFLEGLLAMIDTHKAWCDEQRLTIASDQADFWPRQFVSVEALGLLNLATWLEIAPQDTVALCPREGLCPFQERHFDNFFDELKAVI